MEKRKNTIKK